VFDEPRHRASAGGSAREPRGTAAQPPGVPQVFVVGANASTLGVVNSLKDEKITAQLVPLAITPLGIALGESYQRVVITLSNLYDWIDRTFPAEDDRAFVGSLRDVELLVRVGWSADPPERLDDHNVLNIEDLPEEITDALSRPAVPLVQCAACRRLCVRDHFIWKEKQLCAWDYHAQVFGKRGPWREGAYEERHFQTLPSCAYVVPEPLSELGVEIVLMTGALDDATASAVINTVLQDEPSRPHMAVKTDAGIAILREA
jgi:hypothetical protein